jgi:hypothetical protein
METNDEEYLTKEEIYTILEKKYGKGNCRIAVDGVVFVNHTKSMSGRDGWWVFGCRGDEANEEQLRNIRDGKNPLYDLYKGSFVI